MIKLSSAFFSGVLLPPFVHCSSCCTKHGTSLLTHSASPWSQRLQLVARCAPAGSLTASNRPRVE